MVCTSGGDGDEVTWNWNWLAGVVGNCFIVMRLTSDLST